MRKNSIIKISFANKSCFGEITLPPSKSISNRLLIIKALCEKDFSIQNISKSTDTKVLEDALGNINKTEIINTGDAGTAMRFLTAYLAITPGIRTLTGSERMKKRPLKELVDALLNLGADIQYLEKAGYPPLKITGKKLSGGEVQINSDISSQYISALMMIAPKLPEGLNIQLNKDVVSMPYIIMTADLMKQFDIDISFNKNNISIKPGTYNAIDTLVEPDWSSASYFYSILSLATDGSIYMPGLKEDSIQGDKILHKWFEKLGVISEFNSDGLTIKKIKSISQSSLNFNFINNPDLAQTIAVCCACAGLNADFTGLNTLRIKETDRISALKNELKKINGDFVQKDMNHYFLQCDKEADFSKLSPTVKTYNDHRMAMSFAAIAMKCKSVYIENPDVVKKSYPDFWDNLQKLGFDIDRN